MTDRAPVDSPPPPPAPPLPSATASALPDPDAPCTAVFVDAIEDRVARVLDAQGQGEASWSLPVAWLPANLREGDWLWLTARRSSPPPAPDGKIRAKLSADDPGGPIKL
jgi:hypothetical protein